MAVRENNEAFILDMCGPDDDVLQSPHIVITFADGASSADQAGEMTVSDSGRRFTVSLCDKGASLLKHSLVDVTEQFYQ